MAKIMILDAISKWWALDAKEVVDQINAVPEGEAIDVVINSPGGDVFDGLTIYHALVGHKGDKNVEIHGLAASMASVIAMAGTNIKIGEGGMFMVHDPLCSMYGNAEALRKEAGILDQIRDSIVNIYHRVTNLDKEELKTMMADETWLTADEAVAKGFAKAKIDATDTSSISNRFAAVVSSFAKIPEAAKKYLNYAKPAEKPFAKPEAIDPAKIALDERKRVQDLMGLSFDGFDVSAHIASGASVETVKALGFDVMREKVKTLSAKMEEAAKPGKTPSEILAIINGVGGAVQTPPPDPAPISKEQKLMSLTGVERTKYFRANMAKTGV